MGAITCESSPAPSSISANGFVGRLGYRPELDGLRALAIVAVMGFHSSQIGLPGGFIGVDIFFVLSGYLITTLLFEERSLRGAISLRAFYIRRALRLLPALLMLLSAVWVAVLIAGSRFATTPSIMLSTTLYSLAYVSNWVLVAGTISWPAPLAHLWSLAVEEQFYLAWPIAMVLLFKLRAPRWTIVSALAIAIISIGFLRAWLWDDGAGFIRAYFSTDTRSDGLLIGCLAATLRSSNVFSRSAFKENALALRVVAIAAFITLLIGFFRMNSGAASTYYGGISAIVIASAILVAVLVETRVPLLTMLLSLPPVAWVGRLSYAMYLWHWVIFYGIEHTHHPFENLNSVWEIGGTLICASISFYIVERPCLRLKTRFAAPRRGNISAESLNALQA